MSDVINKFFRYSIPVTDLTLVLFRRIIALSHSVATVILRILGLVPFIPSVVALEVGMPKCWLNIAAVVSMLSCFLKSLLES